MPPHWTVASETGRLAEVLVCPPGDHYRWMPTNVIARRTLAEGRTPDLAALAAQHAELCAALSQAGAVVHRLTPEPHLGFMAYTRDPSVVTHRGPVLGQLARPERRGEYAPVLEFHAAHDSPVWTGFRASIRTGRGLAGR